MRSVRYLAWGCFQCWGEEEMFSQRRNLRAVSERWRMFSVSTSPPLLHILQRPADQWQWMWLSRNVSFSSSSSCSSSTQWSPSSTTGAKTTGVWTTSPTTTTTLAPTNHCPAVTEMWELESTRNNKICQQDCLHLSGTQRRSSSLKGITWWRSSG